VSEWRIHRREVLCGQCQKPFGEGEALYSLLFLDPERLRREDRCGSCFADPGAGEGVLFWRTRHATDRARRLAVDFDAIEELFLALESRKEPRCMELRYLLALLLLRKKRLKLVGVRRAETGETMCVRRPRRTEEFEVGVYELDGERALSLKADLARIFEGSGVEALSSPVVTPESAVAQAPTLEAGG
jgi:hypothetical protein